MASRRRLFRILRLSRPPAVGEHQLRRAHDALRAGLVSYEQKHNEANGENNHDGHDANYS